MLHSERSSDSPTPLQNDQFARRYSSHGVLISPLENQTEIHMIGVTHTCQDRAVSVSVCASEQYSAIHQAAILSNQDLD